MMRNKIVFYKDLYIGATVRDVKKTIHHINKGKKMLNTYIIILANGTDLFEIMHTVLLNQTYYKQHPPIVVGIANGYTEAIEVVRLIIEDYYKQTGNMDIKSLFQTLKD